ncbi:hypothetical protein CFC21_102683 [Triticum aestivum]|uniref:Uncharacterized protein n=3 Tax=Triticum TaxID=4564 RepID=A0A9R0ZZ76_TRITD|nr:hypothetical protein CFC21_102683 [Triticum aestivum]VAI86810.1 unnamed protein product [Triticum turgidum subsp. durum]
MVCIGVAECQHVHRTALDYFLAVLIVVAAVVAVRLLICALVRCLKDGCVAHHHHHSPATTDTDEDMEVWAGTELDIHRHADRHVQQDRRPEAVEVVVPPPARTTA